MTSALRRWAVRPTRRERAAAAARAALLAALTRSAARAIDGASEALFPLNELGAPDYLHTQLPSRVWRYIQAVPPSYRRLLVLLFFFLEWWPCLSLRPSRYSRLSRPQRLALVAGLRASPWYPLRLVGDSVKGVLTMMYCSDPAVLRYMGVYTVSPREGDVDMDARPDALVRLGRTS